ncbi:hypothetical protein CHS0354_014992 [Potamilus streckersoni]|uniref:Fibrinogen C-terminal domain-containing protein n=1 Tax=Potamilus streckersoni TaxID=2493646 RepID=A0AAE0SI98_9BIVA|nr:hypothetical protein CHS0354_014992 [Potamilus streckersoni]
MVGLFLSFLTFAELLINGHTQYPCHCACNCYCSLPQTLCGNYTSSTSQNDYFGKPRDCQDIYQMGFTKSGNYIIYPTTQSKGIYARCDMNTAGGGWTVTQRRVSGDVYFFRMWSDYKNGFGNPNGSLWLGNDNIHSLTAQADYQLHINLAVSETNTSFAFYDTISVGEESSGYRLTVKTYSGTAGDSFSYHSDMKFSTIDRDNDKTNSTQCAILSKSGWWHNYCHTSNLNGIYGSNYFTGIIWRTYTGYNKSLIYSDMKIRRKDS